MKKRCPQCQIFKELSSQFWPKSSNRKDGFHWCCKSCHSLRTKTKAAKLSQQRRDEKRYRLAPEKIKARTFARDYWGSAMKYKCAVLSCSSKAEHLHHLNYDYKMDVVPYCKHHHKLEHER